MWLMLARSNRNSPGPARLAPGVRACAGWLDIAFLLSHYVPTRNWAARKRGRKELIGPDRSGARPLPPGPARSHSCRRFEVPTAIAANSVGTSDRKAARES